VSISASRIYIQSVAQGSFTSSTKVDFTLLELAGEASSQDIMYKCFNLVFSRDIAFPSHEINIFTFNGWFFTNSGSGSIPATSNGKNLFLTYFLIF
jgi:hypothetical protein